MNYRQLQIELKNLKSQGLTTIPLNSKKDVLEAEYNRLIAITPEVEAEDTTVVEETIEVDFTADLAKLESLKQEITDIKQKYLEQSPVVELPQPEPIPTIVESPQPTPPEVINALMVMVTAFVKAIIFIVNVPLRRLTLWSGEVVQNYHKAVGWWLGGFSPPSFT